MNECGQRKERNIREEGKVNGCGRVWVGVRHIAISVLKRQFTLKLFFTKEPLVDLNVSQFDQFT